MGRPKIIGATGSDGWIKTLVDKTIVRLVSYTRSQSTAAYTVLTELERRTAGESADYAQQHMQNAIHFESRIRLWGFALSKMTIDGMLGEFGVFGGMSINQIARKASELRGKEVTVYGFDSFEGLKEDWSGNRCPKGTFDLRGKLPPVSRNVTLIKGWFDQSVPAFLRDHSGPFSFIHVDSDTFAAAETILALIGDRIVPGTVIVFDEYFGYRGWKDGEHKAWTHFVNSRRIKYEYLGFSAEAVAVRVV